MSRDPERAAGQFFGGRVCLDFANTLDWRLTDSPVELIPDYARLLGWSSRRGTLPAHAISRLRQHEAASRACGELMRQAHALRAEIWALAEDLIARRPLRLDRLNARMAQLPSQPPLCARSDRCAYELDGEDLRQPLWPILWSLTALLVSEDASRIGSCAARGCGWYFVDESPNRSRMWCSSQVCGNRERARRSYAKSRSRP